jgi:hybrid cluster-associated redox disulfide protein
LSFQVKAIAMSHPIENPDLPLDELMTRWPETIRVFLDYRLLCVGCLIAPFHTVIDACREHGVDEQSFRADLHRAIGAQLRPSLNRTS